MYAIKEAVIAKEHSKTDLDCAIFFMDMRTHGKDFERYYDRARLEEGVRFIRSRVHTIDHVLETGDVNIWYADETGQIISEQFDMVVLSVGMETTSELKELAGKLGIDLTEQGFSRTSSFSPVVSSRNGIYVCGAFQGPKDIPQSVIEASAAAAAAGFSLTPARGSLTSVPEEVQEISVVGERPRVGVFVCHCGVNISGVVDVPAVRDYTQTLPFVEYVSDNLYSCSQDNQDRIAEIIKEKKLNRIVVAACTPRTHEPLFQETLRMAGLNKYLFEMANIRNQDSWVHVGDPVAATEKAKDLVRMAVSKIALLEPLTEQVLTINQAALVIGGGIAGITAAKSLSSQGYQVYLIEKNDRLGGQARSLYQTWRGESIQQYLVDLITSVQEDPRIKIFTGTEINNVEGFVGNFKTELNSGNGETTTIEHGVTIIASGAHEYRPTEYLYGQNERVLTHQDLDRFFIESDEKLNNLNNVVFIQCMGSREPERPYCSRVCCTHSVESALEIKHRNPDTNVFILYRDLRTYGERELIYKKAREAGVIFSRFSVNNKPLLKVNGSALEVTFMDHVLGRPVQVEADLLVLASAIVSARDEKLAQFFKVPLNADGFLVEAHAKLRPVEFATDGVFLCGLAHYPKPIDESIAQAQAAASRAVTLLSAKTVHTAGTIADVKSAYCSSCGVCVSICPYSAPSFDQKTAKSVVNPVLCKGCGLCVASCRSGAISLKGFDTSQIFAQIEAV
jgi:heterodisulfide reductase subunit A